MKNVAETHISEAAPNDLDNVGAGPHGAPQIVDDEGVPAPGTAIAGLETSKKGRFAYFKTKQFYIVLILGYVRVASCHVKSERESRGYNIAGYYANPTNRQVLSLCLTATNTFSSLLANNGNSIPAFQTWFNYVLLNLIYTSYTIYRYGFKGYCRFLWTHGWKCMLEPATAAPHGHFKPKLCTTS